MNNHAIGRGLGLKLICLLALITLMVQIGFSAKQSHNPFVPITKPDKISVMSFNVENLFDTQHDPGKHDFTYLPVKLKNNIKHKAFCQDIKRKYWRDQCLYFDWSAKHLQKKLKALANTILQTNQGRGPDIIVLQEIENIAVLEQLRTQYLQAAQYGPSILIEGNDRRGIDVAILSRLGLSDPPKLHVIPFKNLDKDEARSTRGILQASFQLPDKTELTVFGVHFPSPYHNKEFRIQAMNFLNRLKNDLSKQDLVLAAGDFNIPAEEDKSYKILNKHVQSDWVIAHQLACKGCRGTHYYAPKLSWSFLDMILLSKNLSLKPNGENQWHLNPTSIRIANQHPDQNSPKNTPKSFDIRNGKGVSDHWPIYLELERQININ